MVGLGAEDAERIDSLGGVPHALCLDARPVGGRLARLLGLRALCVDAGLCPLQRGVRLLAITVGDVLLCAGNNLVVPLASEDIERRYKGVLPAVANEVEHETITLARSGAQSAPNALRVQGAALRWAAHCDARNAWVVVPLRENTHVAKELVFSRLVTSKDVPPCLEGCRAIDGPRRPWTIAIEHLCQSMRVVDGRGEQDGASVAGQLDRGLGDSVQRLLR